MTWLCIISTPGTLCDNDTYKLGNVYHKCLLASCFFSFPMDMNKYLKIITIHFCYRSQFI